MRAEEIIRLWKDEDGSRDEKKPEPGAVSTNPVGRQELSDEELEVIEGAMLAESRIPTCPNICFNSANC